MTPIESPCIDVCKLENNVCIGCMRTIDEIAQWGGLSDAQRTVIMNRIWGDDVSNEAVLEK